MTQTAKIISLSVISLGISLFAQAVNSQVTGPPDPASARAQQQNARDASRRLLVLADTERQATKGVDRPSKLAPRVTLEKSAMDRVEFLRRVSDKEAAPYAEMLKDRTAGMFKIFPNLNCITEYIVSVAADCSNFVPMSSLVSFRQRAYVDDPIQDIEYADGELRANGFFTQGSLIDVGDVPLQSAAANSRLLSAIKTIGRGDSHFDNARITVEKLRSGLLVGENTFNNRVKAVVGHTYVLRSVAYKARTSLPSVEQSTPMQLRFHAVNFDKRYDVTVVFRVLSRDALNGLTVLWKEVDRNEAPTLHFAKGQPLSDLK